MQHLLYHVSLIRNWRPQHLGNPIERIFYIEFFKCIQSDVDVSLGFTTLCPILLIESH
jgi:hypothetical protein